MSIALWPGYFGDIFLTNASFGKKLKDECQLWSNQQFSFKYFVNICLNPELFQKVSEVQQFRRARSAVILYAMNREHQMWSCGPALGSCINHHLLTYKPTKCWPDAGNRDLCPLEKDKLPFSKHKISPSSDLASQLIQVLATTTCNSSLDQNVPVWKGGFSGNCLSKRQARQVLQHGWVPLIVLS